MFNKLPAATVPVAARKRSAPLSVLAIDDDPGLLRIVEQCCRRKGWNVKIQSDLKQGIELERSALPEVILCDAEMPNLSGPQIIAMLKANPETAGIPVVLMSGFANADMFSHVPWAGFLDKPFGPKELIAAIESVAP
jgi:CheY-like chemotaxis protein